METLKDLWNKACFSADIPAISIDTSARIFAVVYVYGNNEAFVYNKSFLSDIRYIQKRFRIYGTGIPDADFVALLQKYIKELEHYQDIHKNDKSEDEVVFKSHAPVWAEELFRDRYGIKIL